MTRTSSEAAWTGLHIDVTEALAFFAVLEEHRQADDEKRVHADHSEDGSEDVVEKTVRKGGDWADAARLEGGSRGRRADLAGDKGGGGAVEVAAAFELKVRWLDHFDYKERAFLTQPFIHVASRLRDGKGRTHRGLYEALHLGSLAVPNSGEVVLRGKSEHPQIDTDGHGKEGTESNEPAGHLEPAACWGDHAGESKEEGDKDEDGVGDASCESGNRKHCFFVQIFSH